MNKATKDIIIFQIEQLRGYIQQYSVFIDNNQKSIDKYKKMNEDMENEIKQLEEDLR